MMTNEQNLAWAAGYIEEHGTFWHEPSGEIAFSARADSNITGLERFARIFGLEIARTSAKKRRGGVRVRLEGQLVRELVKDLWPYLTNDRRRFIEVQLRTSTMLKQTRAGRITG